MKIFEYIKNDTDLINYLMIELRDEHSRVMKKAEYDMIEYSEIRYYAGVYDTVHWVMDIIRVIRANYTND